MEENGLLSIRDLFDLRNALHAPPGPCETLQPDLPPFWRSADNLGEKKIWVNCETKVGINTDNPDAHLDVRGKATVQLLTIGTPDLPSDYRLSINGKMITEEVRVLLASQWPDYVFEQDYELLPLEEVKIFVEKEKHLPGIPKAAEIEKEGFDVGDMQRLMMEKIEELFLYTIKLNEELQELKKENSALKQLVEHTK